MEGNYQECSACKKEARLMGYLIAVPTILGILFALLMCYSTVCASSSNIVKAADFSSSACAGFFSGFDFWCPAFIAVFSLIMGVAGWSLAVRKKLHKCVICGHIAE